MNRSPRLPVDQVSDQVWRRVREEVFAELRRTPSEAAPRPLRPGRARRWAVGVAAAIAVAGAVLVAGRFLDNSQQPRSYSSRIVATPELTRTTLGDVTVEVSPGTELVSTGSETEAHTVVLERGRAVFSVPSRGSRPPFRVHAADVVVEVIGTKFAVSRDGSHVKVIVTEGVVQVTAQGTRTLLQAGNEWSLPQPRDSESISSPADAAAKPQGTESEPVVPPSRSAPPAVRSNAVQSLPATSTEPQPPSARSRYEEASRLEPKDPARAVELYLSLAREGGSWAPNALFAAARLELERGRRQVARDLLNEYLTRFPRGPNAPEAKQLLERIK